MTMIAPLPPLKTAKAFDKLKVGRFFSTVLPDIDFETFSAAGFHWDAARGKWNAPRGATKKGLFAVGSAVYTQHPTADILSCSYNLKNGTGPKRWLPGMPLPLDLFQYLLSFDAFAVPSYDQRGVIEAHNAMFEVRVCLAILAKKHGWPVFELRQFRCSAAKARAHALPGALGNLGEVLGVANAKDKGGKRLLDKFSIPQTPSKKQPKVRILPQDEPDEAELLYKYNDQDIVAESEVSAVIPDLPPDELEYWLCDQEINYRGVQCDVAAVHNCILIMDQAFDKYDAELAELTGGLAVAGSETARIKDWAFSHFGVSLPNMTADTIDDALEMGDDLPNPVRRALEIRQLTGSASVKKIYAMARQATADGRLCDMAIYHGARTGRDNGDGVQPLNMPKAGPDLVWCQSTRLPYGQHATSCPHCAAVECRISATAKNERLTSWNAEAVEFALATISTGILEIVEFFFGDALLLISGCARGLFIARDGYELMGVDYSSIEAVAAACLSGEQWRIDAFTAKQCIYLASASQITGKSLEWYAANGGKKHPDRQKIGKPAELGLGFGGWIGAWRQFDKTDTFTDDEVKENIIKWRAKSPAIVEMWGGQCRGMPWRPQYFELYGLEGAAIAAVQNPGKEFSYRGIAYFVECGRLYCRLLSGRHLTYHNPRLAPHPKWDGHVVIKFQGWNTNPKKGALGWIWMEVYGGLLFENVVQATARDIMAHGVKRMEREGMPVVLRVHDEVVTETPIGSRSEAEQLKYMLDLPDWCKWWPVGANGWGEPKKRYQKD